MSFPDACLVILQKQDETPHPLSAPPTDMDGELLVTLVNGAVSAIVTRLQSECMRSGQASTVGEGTGVVRRGLRGRGDYDDGR